MQQHSLLCKYKSHGITLKFIHILYHAGGRAVTRTERVADASFIGCSLYNLHVSGIRGLLTFIKFYLTHIVTFIFENMNCNCMNDMTALRPLPVYRN